MCGHYAPEPNTQSIILCTRNMGRIRISLLPYKANLSTASTHTNCLLCWRWGRVDIFRQGCAWQVDRAFPRRTLWCHPQRRSGVDHNEIIISNNSKTMFMVLLSWQSHCESSHGLFDECRTAPSARWPSYQARRLRLWVCLYRVPESTPTIAVYSYYSTQKLILILPSHGG